MKIMLDSDTCACAHERVLQKVTEVNQGAQASYGQDVYSDEARQLLQKHFGKKTNIYFALTGTGANLLALKPGLASFGAVMCTDIAHLHTHETGACEAVLGAKLLTVPHQSGKLSIEGLEQYLSLQGNPHVSQPQMISLSQCTEYGTVYRVEEIKQLSEFAHEHGLLVHMDGARLVNAAAFLGVSLQKMTFDAGVDVLSFGLTKNGAMMAESVIFAEEALAHYGAFYQKQLMQMACKMRFVAAQYIAMLEGDLWIDNARHANKMAQLLAKGIQEKLNLAPDYPVESNAIFLTLTDALLQKLRELAVFSVWQPAFNQVRMVTAFNTTEAEIEQFIQAL